MRLAASAACPMPALDGGQPREFHVMEAAFRNAANGNAAPQQNASYEKTSSRIAGMKC
ncbi:hypothetical protein [Rubrivivax gelatinosus]|uniref:hypothetical protein n=1 Tax=Rubrivivax gelatinosus TaxID=28068 RepID=UPI001405248F|nr:hypothetical protein [Rubrivivax gelatinosus]